MMLSGARGVLPEQMENSVNLADTHTHAHTPHAWNLILVVLDSVLIPCRETPPTVCVHGEIRVSCTKALRELTGNSVSFSRTLETDRNTVSGVLMPDLQLEYYISIPEAGLLPRWSQECSPAEKPAHCSTGFLWRRKSSTHLKVTTSL